MPYHPARARGLKWGYHVRRSPNTDAAGTSIDRVLRRTHGRSLGRSRLITGIAGSIAFVFVTLLLIPEYLVGREVVPESWDAFIDLGVMFALGGLLLRRPVVVATDDGRHRTTTRGLLLALLVVAFTGAAAAIVNLLVHAGLLPTLAAIGLVGISITPLRAFIDWRADAVLFGDRDDPYRVITSLGRRIEAAGTPDTVLPDVVATVADALELTYAAIELEDAGGVTIAASFGVPGRQLARFPLTYQSEPIGALVVDVPANQRLTATDRKLLTDLSSQIGIAARAAQLVLDLRQSNLRMATTREEERHRLRRDLHDGLGPVLAGIGLASQAARNLLPTDPDAADLLMRRVVEESGTATVEVRRLLDNLQPPSLDRLGLVEALRQKTEDLVVVDESTGGLTVSVVQEGELPDLPALVQVAAFRIALESFANVLKHAEARTCLIRVWWHEALELEIVDDGVGLPTDLEPGVGIASMAERARELGGTCTVRRRQGGGTEVRATLPCSPAARRV